MPELHSILWLKIKFLTRGFSPGLTFPIRSAKFPQTPKKPGIGSSPVSSFTLSSTWRLTSGRAGQGVWFCSLGEEVLQVGGYAGNRCPVAWQQRCTQKAFSLVMGRSTHCHTPLHVLQPGWHHALKKKMWFSVYFYFSITVGIQYYIYFRCIA